MEWFRVYHGICADPKLHRLANAAGVRRSVVIACWIAVLETASTRTERGTIGDLDGEGLGFMVGESKAVGTRVLGLFRDRGMVTADGKVSAWDQRQRNSDDAAERKRRQRLNQNSAHTRLLAKDESALSGNPLKTGETQAAGHGTVTPRTEQIEEDKTPPLIPPQEPALPAAPPAPDTEPKRRACAMPVGFALSSDMAAYAERKCPGIDAERTFEQFADHHRAKGSTFKDWPAAWRTWVNSPYGKIMRHGHQPRGSPPRATIDGTLEILNRSGFFDADRHDTDPDGGGFDAAARGLPFYSLN